ncbi:MAG: hypothetical protein RLZZ220_2515 [Pseudomonadota bacterium]|jgi:hypothetical protein|uniref:Uncharacterized protein n=1 Tax=Zoogloea ramigera TaxID=350 RepID=A0A4Y4CVK3_ZOORA|nr:hypothetical protein [Zoogloea ramigera]GEC96908.1 hypothetical protein ZRA01_29810 [Zoogloea ramigera]
MSHMPRETGAPAGLSRKHRAAPRFLAPLGGRAGRSLALGALSCVLVWIAHTSQASRLARLASQGLGLPPATDPSRECWREDMGREADNPPR